VKKIGKWLSLVCTASCLAIWLLSANVAAADTFGATAGEDLSASDFSGTGDLPASGLNGWFFNTNPPQPGLPLTDLSLPWTSAQNIATMNYWLSLVTELDDNPSLLPQLYGLGMTSSPDAATPEFAVVSQVGAQTLPSNVPEPVTGGLPRDARGKRHPS
jgi:hypothetical protein